MCALFSISNWWEATKGPLATAGINTIVGLCVVFVALVFISFIISLFKYIGKLEGKLNKNDVASSSAAPAAVSTASVDNFELVAILTSAITEYEEAQGHFFKDGMTICSIKKLS